ncbi:MAG: bifunctional phosphoribosylaminoimidazolecarboxamide formyltransferase/IMP cyclohydrolase, partial [bacterium]|nr:bifunctional phosphoribosylaminoimidazolecarboxamide formyltransferase/IMP cyclohydrolase [bacterium]
EEGDVSLEERKRLAAKAFSYTSFYDSLVAGYMGEEFEQLPMYMNPAGEKAMDLRYGENPHQKASLYLHDKQSPLERMEQLQGKELSFNNILDLSMVYEVLNQFAPKSEDQQVDDFSVVVKHQNPCGAAVGSTQKEAFIKAFEGDSRSAFGGIVGFNKPLDVEAAEEMKKIFFEVIIAPDFTPEAVKVFKKKKNLRLVKMPLNYVETADIKTVPGGFVFQGRDNETKDYDAFELKTSRQLTEQEIVDVRLGWKLIKFVLSRSKPSK